MRFILKIRVRSIVKWLQMFQRERKTIERIHFEVGMRL